jgi:hypothetical protein
LGGFGSWSFLPRTRDSVANRAGVWLERDGRMYRARMDKHRPAGWKFDLRMLRVGLGTSEFKSIGHKQQLRVFDVQRAAGTVYV